MAEKAIPSFATLASPMRIRRTTAKNRIVLPPMVVCGLHPEGAVNDAVVAHYEAFAAGGCGVLVQEATCVSPDGKLAAHQLGLWADGQVDGMRRIVAACRPHGPLLLVQIHHARAKRELETTEVERIRDDFVAAAVRAERAGNDGVELHGAHGYFLCAFLNPRLNRRSDRYGEPLRLVREILEGIRAATGPDFIVGIRIGADNPELATGIAQCVALEGLGIDFLDVSSGLSEPGSGPLPVPEGFPFSELAFRGCEVRKCVTKTPVIAVGDLNDPIRAAWLVEGGYADFAAVGRGMLVDPAWARKALAGEPIHPCLDCAMCRWFRHHEECPGRQKAMETEARG